MKKRILVFLLLLWLVPFSAAAQDYGRETAEQYGESLFDALPAETAAALKAAGVDLQSENLAQQLTMQSVWEYFKDFVQSGGKAPLQSGCAVLALLLAASVVGALAPAGEIGTAVHRITTAAIGIAVAAPIWSVVQATAAAVRSCGTFLTAFVPIFAALLAVGGATATAAASGAVLLGAAALLSGGMATVILPLTGCCLALHLTGRLSPVALGGQLADGLQKAVFWLLTLGATVFVGILGAQTAIGTATDGVALKTAKFLVGTAVPVAGSALSEAASALASSVTLLRSSVAIFGVVAVAAIVLPILAELLLWRLVLTGAAALAEGIGLDDTQKMLQAVEKMIGLLGTVLLLSGAALILGLAVVVQAAPSV